MRHGAAAREAHAPCAWAPSPSQAIASWLLDGPAVLRDGPNAGAVAGCVDASGTAPYAYPEIAGYYLQWLAWRAARAQDSRLRVRATAVERWLRKWMANTPAPQTRVHLGTRNDPAHDWRNDAVFCFDLAMVLRGLASATAAKLIAADPWLVNGVAGQLLYLVGDDGVFDACRALQASVPERWSTRRGPYLAKAAAGVASACATFPHLPAALADAAERTLAASVDALLARPHRELHPLLYAIEGVLAMSTRPAMARMLPQIERMVDDVLAHASADGTLPEVVGVPGPQRLDVMAQALRVVRLLPREHCGSSSRTLASMRIRHALERQIRPSGALPFAMAAPSMQWNTWTCMFADQALAPGYGAVPAADAPALV